MWQGAARGAWAATDGVIRYALPPRCPGCGTIVAGDHRFCADCWRALDFLAGPACPRCGEPREGMTGFDVDQPCERCVTRPFAFDAVRAGVSYGVVARAVALGLKHGRRTGLAVTIARRLEPLARAEDASALLVPVPLHRGRLWKRGFNQAALIARAVGRRSGQRTALGALTRDRPTRLLRGLGRSERADAVRDAIAVAPRWAPRIAGRSILLVDDVFTTGATAQACAYALRAAGAARVVVLCWARVPRDGVDKPNDAPHLALSHGV